MHHINKMTQAFDHLTNVNSIAFDLNENNYHPTELDTKAVLTFEEGVITKIEMELKASIPEINQDEFNALAEEAKQNCPISGVLKCDILLEASLV